MRTNLILSHGDHGIKHTGMLKKILLHPLAFFPVLTCVFYWPLSLQVFTLKNDALTYYYPVRTLISDALHNHELPLWTPFINMGYPLHADMQSAAWNPVVWLFAAVTDYKLAGFHAEILFYLAFGGMGFYWLIRDHRWRRSTALIVALAYEFSGPLVDSMQFTAIIAAACYIPYTLLFFRRLLRRERPLLNALLTAVFLFLLMTGSYPAMFIITLYVLLSFFVVAFVFAPGKWAFSGSILGPLLLIALSFCALSLPALISFANHLGLIDRGRAQGLSFVLQNSMPPACMLSLISPFSTTATTALFDTDLLMRNVYIGIVPLLFIVYGLCNKSLRNNRTTRLWMLAAVLLLGMAWGGHFFLRQLAYYTLPLMNTFRHPALFRYFAVVFLLLFAGRAVDDWQTAGTNDRLKKILALFFALVALAVFVLAFTNGAALVRASALRPAELLARLNAGERFLIQAPFLVATLACFFWLLGKKADPAWLVVLVAADLFFATQLNMPVTVIGARRFDAVESFIAREPGRFPLPGNAAIEENIANTFDSTRIIGSRLPFVKKIGRNDYFFTPGNLAAQERFYESPLKDLVFKNPVLYLAGVVLPYSIPALSGLQKPGVAVVSPATGLYNAAASAGDSARVTGLSANSVSCLVRTAMPRLLVLLQNEYPGWKVFVDGKKAELVHVNTSFMGVNVPEGRHSIRFIYDPQGIRAAWWVSFIVFCGITLYATRSLLISRRFFTQQEQ